MEIKEIQRPERKSVVITVRTTQSNKDLIDRYNLSPSKIFDIAIEELSKLQEVK